MESNCWSWLLKEQIQISWLPSWLRHLIYLCLAKSLLRFKDYIRKLFRSTKTLGNIISNIILEETRSVNQESVSTSVATGSHNVQVARKQNSPCWIAPFLSDYWSSFPREDHSHNTKTNYKIGFCRFLQETLKNHVL